MTGVKKAAGIKAWFVWLMIWGSYCFTYFVLCLIIYRWKSCWHFFDTFMQCVMCNGSVCHLSHRVSLAHCPDYHYCPSGHPVSLPANNNTNTASSETKNRSNMYDYVTKGWRDLTINMSSPWIYLKGTRVINHPVNSVRSVLVFTAHIIIISPDHK